MQRGNYFWGALLVLAGFVLLMERLGLFGNINVWALLWPVFIILLGAWILFGTLFRGKVTSEQATVALEGAQKARIKLVHGAGRMDLSAGEAGSNLLEGQFGTGVDVSSHREGDTLVAKLTTPVNFFPWNFEPGALDWNLTLNRDLPLVLEVESGASESRLDLSEMQVVDLRLRSGASSTRLTLPARAGHVRASIEAGAASVEVSVPAGVAARIRSRSGISSIKVDTARFPQLGDGYQSADYDTAANKVELDVQMGAGSLVVS